MTYALASYGLHGNGVRSLKQWADQGCLILDIRFTPWSVCPAYQQPSLKALLGERYAYLRDLGNRNYKNGGEILIDNPERGLGALYGLLQQSPVILVCTCKSPCDCHRSVIAQLAIDAGIVDGVTHLVPGERWEVGNA